MNTSTRITAFLADAYDKHPYGFTMDVNTGEVIDHGIAVAGYHQNHGDGDGANWLEVDNGGIRNNYAYPTSSKTLPFDEIQEAVEAWLPIIQTAGYLGGWRVTGTLILDIVQVYPCILHQDGIADATPFLEGSRLDQQAIGWLCPDFENGYKEVGVNF